MFTFRTIQSLVCCWLLIDEIKHHNYVNWESERRALSDKQLWCQACCEHEYDRTETIRQDNGLQTLPISETRGHDSLSDNDKLSPNAIYLNPHTLPAIYTTERTSESSLGMACVYKICMHNDMTSRIVMGKAEHRRIPRTIIRIAILTGAITLLVIRLGITVL